MKKFVIFLLSVVASLLLIACSGKDTGSIPANATVEDSSTESQQQIAWPSGTFFEALPKAAAYVDRLSFSEDGSFYAMTINDMSYKRFLEYIAGLEEAGVWAEEKSWEQEDVEMSGLAAFVGSMDEITVTASWTPKDSPVREKSGMDCDVSITFRKILQN